MNKTRVLFICTGNSCRSQMAEAFLKKYAGDKYEVYSAGLEAQGIHPNTIKVMKEIGIDISKQKSKDLKKYLGKKHFGILITVCARAEEECPIFPDVSTRLYWPFDDPRAAEGSEDEILNKFREVRDQIEAKVQNFIETKEN